MIGFKERAEIYRLGLISGLFSKNDVINWVDAVIEEEGNVDYALIEVSLNSSKKSEDIAAILKNVGGEFDSKIVVNIIIGLLALKYAKNHDSGSEIVTILHKLSKNIDSDVLGNDVNSIINSLNEGYYLAEQNIYGSIKDMNYDLNNFLKDYVKYAELF